MQAVPILPSCGFQVQQVLGSGTSSGVYLVERLKDRAYFALKLYKRTNPYNGLSLNEVDLLSRYRHPNISRLEQFLLGKNCPIGLGLVVDLASYSLSAIFRRIDEGQKVKITQQLLLAVAFLHYNGVLHIDIKMDNILISSNWDAVLTDFGYSLQYDPVIIDIPKKMKWAMGTPVNTAPEVIAGFLVSSKSDVWSVGTVILDLFAKRPYFKESDDPRGSRSKILSFGTHLIEDLLSNNDPYLVSNLAPLLGEIFKEQYYQRPTIEKIFAFLQPVFARYSLSVPNLAKSAGESPYYAVEKFSNVHRNTVIDLMMILVKLYPDHYAEEYFLIVDLYYRLLPWNDSFNGNVESDRANSTLLISTCLWMAHKLINLTNLDASKLVIALKQTKNYPQQITADHLISTEESIVEGLSGILYRPYIWHRCRSLDQVINVFPVTLDGKIYGIMNLDVWIPTLGSETPEDKNITIAEYFNLIKVE